MNESEITMTQNHRWRFRVSLRLWMALIAVVGVTVGLFYRRIPITPRNVGELKTVARLDNQDIWQVVWSPDRSKLALITWEQPVEIRDTVSLWLQDTIGRGKKIVGFAFSSNEDVVAYCENNKIAVILNRKTLKQFRLDTENDQPHLTFSPDGSFLATGGYGTDVKLWRVADGELVRSFVTGSTQGGLTPEFSPDGKLLAVGNRNAETTLFDVATGALRSSLPKPWTHGLQFDPSGRTLAVAYVDGTVRLWRVADGALIFERKTKAKELYSLDWSPDGSMLATSGLRAPITLWDGATMSVVREIDAPEWVSRVRFSPDGLNLVFSGGKSGAANGRRRHLEVMGIEGALFTFLHRPRR